MDLPPLTVEILGHKRIFSQSFSGIGVQTLPGCAHWRSWAVVQGLSGLCSLQDGGGGHFHRLLAELFLVVVEFTASLVPHWSESHCGRVFLFKISPD